MMCSQVIIYSCHSGYSEHLHSLINQMLKVDSSARITISQVAVAMDTTTLTTSP